MNFPNVIGQTAIQQQLMDLVQHNRLSHALLLLGKEGSGVLPLAVGFGQYVVSQKRTKPKQAPPLVADLFGGFTALPAAENEDDNLPPAFEGFDTKALDLVHPDLHFSYPVITTEKLKKPTSADYAKEWRSFYQNNPYGNTYDWLQSIKAENKQGNITVEECNDIMHKLSLKAFESEYKVLVMWMPELLREAGNRLLKLIEEPPPDTLFILAAENENLVLQTIVSRCQVIRVPPLSPHEIEQALQTREGASEEKAQQIAMVCNGNYREALELLLHHEDNWNALLRDWLNATLVPHSAKTNRFAMQNKIVADLAALGRENQKQLLRYFLQLLELSMRLQLIGEEHLSLPPAEKEFAQRLNKRAGPNTLAAMAEALENGIYYVERNANAKLLFHALTIRLFTIIQQTKVLVAT